MNDELKAANGAAVPPPQMTFGLTEDLKTIMWNIPAPGPDGTFGILTLTLPATDMPGIEGAISQLCNMLRAKGVLPPAPKVQARVVTTMVVGRSNMAGFEKFTVIDFNKGQTDEGFYVLDDHLALTLADGIEQQVFHGMSLDDQKKMVQQVEKARGGGKLILPPGVTRQ